MAFPTRVLAGFCEISSGALTFAEAPPIFTGENAALTVSVVFQLNGVNYDVSGCAAEMYLIWDGAREMSEAVSMTVLDNTAMGSFPESMTLRAGAPLLVIQLTDAGTGALIVACAHPVQITNARADAVITTRPGTPSEVVYVGRSPYIANDGYWMYWDADQNAYVSSGVQARGETGYGISSIAKTGTSGAADTYTITISDGSTYTFTVTNGTNISRITKTATAGLVDTYTVLLTDGSTTTFEVTNGSGINGAVSMYAKSSSGTTPPQTESDWKDNVAATGAGQGDYVWTRTVFNFANGTSQTAYSVSYMGIDGEGVVPPDYTGATGSANGTRGMVKQPLAGDQDKFLRGDGSWSEPPARFGTGTGATASGIGTVANHRAQIAAGEYNVPDASAAAATERGAYIEIVGNGTQSTPANARTLDWSGNETISGSMTASAFYGAGTGLTSVPASALPNATASSKGAVQIGSGLTINDGVLSVSTASGATLLWRNPEYPTPTSSFTAETTVNLTVGNDGVTTAHVSDFTFIYITAIYNATIAQERVTVVAAPIGTWITSPVQASAFVGYIKAATRNVMRIASREVTLMDSQIKFGLGTYMGGTSYVSGTSDQLFVPLEIYGIKL